MIGQGHVRDPEKYNNKTVNEWHMRSFGESCTAIDMDLGGYCRDCYVWLYIIEAAETPTKPTNLVQRLAMQTGSIGLLIVHGGGEVQKAQRIWPDRSPWFSEPQARAYIGMIRDAHTIYHRQPSNGGVS